MDLYELFNRKGGGESVSFAIFIANFITGLVAVVYSYVFLKCETKQ
jgi:hypothetical protein